MILLSLFLLVAIATFTDLRARRIPNWLVASAIALALPLQIGAYGLLNGSMSWICGMLIGLTLFLPGYLMRMMGAGDVKLMAAIGALAGVLPIIEIVCYSYIFGGVFALLVMLLRGQIGRGLRNIKTWLTTMLIARQTHLPQELHQASRIESVGTLPYAVPIALGTVYVLLSGI